MKTKLIGTGSYLPQIQMTNDDIAKIVETNDEWIRTRTGIEQRHIAKEETTCSMAIEAAKQALADAHLTGAELDLIIVATCSADTLVPSTACCVQSALQADSAFAFDLNAACSGFAFAVSVADAYIKSGAAKRVLIIGVETISKLIDWTDRSSCILFGDGAGAAVFEASDTPEGVLASVQHSDGSMGHVLTCKSRSNNNPYISTPTELDHVSMNGQEVFRFAVKRVSEIIPETLDKAGLSLQDIDLFLMHQANIRIIQAIAKKLKLPMEKFPSNVQQCGNTSAASLPILLDECRKNGTVQQGQKILLCGFGAGLTWGAMILQL